jgi:O-methyltransferase
MKYRLKMSLSKSAEYAKALSDVREAYHDDSSIKLDEYAKSKNISISITPKGKTNPMQLWDDDDVFVSLYEDCKEYSVCSRPRHFMLYQFVKQTKNLPGVLAEAGVFNGGSAKLILDVLDDSTKEVHLFDTFEGFPDHMVDSSKDWNKAGQSTANYSEVKKLFNPYPNSFLHKGIFPDTADAVKDKTFSFVHVDMDLYESVKSCCEFFYSRMVEGGVLIFDDYGFWAQFGSKIAVDEFFEDKPESPIYLSHSGQCFIIKL